MVFAWRGWDATQTLNTGKTMEAKTIHDDTTLTAVGMRDAGMPTHVIIEREELSIKVCRWQNI